MTRETAIYKLYITFRCEKVPIELIEHAFDNCMKQPNMTEAIAYCGLKHGMGKILGITVTYTFEELADMFGMSTAKLETLVNYCKENLKKATKKERHKLRKQEPYKTLIKSNLL
jgi:hypothetical protein